jgi:hypothetical protein
MAGSSVSAQIAVVTQPVAEIDVASIDDQAIPPPPPAKSRYDRSIVEGPLLPAIWKLAWPTMLTNIFGGLQGMVDNILVGHLVGYEANAGIGVANQI